MKPLEDKHTKLKEILHNLPAEVKAGLSTALGVNPDTLALPQRLTWKQRKEKIRRRFTRLQIRRELQDETLNG